MRWTSRYVALLSSALVAAALVPAVAVSPGGGDQPATRHMVLLRGGAAEGVERADTRRVEARAAITSTGVQRARALGASVSSEFGSIGGYAADLTPGQVEALRRDPDVVVVYPDRVRVAPALRPHSAAEQVPPASPGMQRSPAWGIDRIDQRNLPLDQSYRWTHTGTGTTVYVMDSGIRESHKELVGKVRPGFSVVKDGRGTGDCYGHGTYVASIVAGNSYGVARGASVVPVRFFNCQGAGNDEGFLGALDWLLKNGKPGEILNASWGEVVDAQSTADKTDKIIENIVANGVTVVAAAGNKSIDACGYSPARVPALITVGGSDKNDKFDRSYSNYGRCVDIMAPGTNIEAAWYKNDTDKHSGDGTSASVPFVVGALAIYRQLNPTATPAQMQDWVKSQATSRVLKNLPAGTPDALLYLNPDM